MGSYDTSQRLKVSSVCIIGAGPSGLAAAKYLIAERSFSRITIYEQRAGVGGIWNYVPCEGGAPKDLAVPQTNPLAPKDEPIWRHSGAGTVLKAEEVEQADFMTPLYDRLETNIPRGLMGFSDLEWPSDCQLFPKHEEVLEYIERYADDIRDKIKFNVQVLEVRPGVRTGWIVKSQEVRRTSKDSPLEEEFDAVVVASGHFNVPYIPQVNGLQEWSKAYPGSVSHSKFYRRPEDYAGRKVIVVGNSASGIDIGAQIQSVCQAPLLMSQKSESMLLSSNSSTKRDMPPIVEFIIENRSVRFKDGTVEADIDAVLYCTGYFYSFPFLSSLEPPLITSGERVENLYQHIFYRPRATLTFQVLNQKIIPFPMAEAQGSVIARAYSGRLPLPSEEDMKAWEDDVARQMGDGRGFHVLKFPMDADYINMCHDWALSADHNSHTPKQNGHANGFATNGNPTVGKIPPYWGETEYWARERFPAIKKAFQDFGEDRHSKRTLQDVGFSFEDWKASFSNGKQTP